MFFLEAQRSTLGKPWNGPGSSWAHPHAKEYHLLHEANHQNVGAAAAHTTAKPETQPLGDHQHHRQWKMHHQQPESSPKQLQNYLGRDVGLGRCSETYSRCKLGNFEENYVWIGLITSLGQGQCLPTLEWGKWLKPAKAELYLARVSKAVSALSRDFGRGSQHGSARSLLPKLTIQGTATLWLLNTVNKHF